jgi:hypothetical protein
MKLFIAVAGNIGAGKSTLAKTLSTELNWEYFKEPFDENPYLEKFYMDMSRWALHCDTFFLSRRLRDHLEILKKETPVIQDRSIYETSIFTDNLYYNHSIDKHDWETSKLLQHNIMQTLPPPNLIIFLDTSVDRCLKNVAKRARDMESYNEIALYIKNLDSLYQKWLAEFTLCPILKITNNDFDFKKNKDHVSFVVNKLFEKIYPKNQQKNQNTPQRQLTFF